MLALTVPSLSTPLPAFRAGRRCAWVRIHSQVEHGDHLTRGRSFFAASDATMRMFEGNRQCRKGILRAWTEVHVNSEGLGHRYLGKGMLMRRGNLGYSNTHLARVLSKVARTYKQVTGTISR